MNLSTKQARLDSQRAQFDNMLNNGYTQETYKGLNIFTLTEGNKFLVKIFKNTASHAIAFYNY